MFKKLLIASAVLATSSTIALANGTPYVGVGLGYNTLNSKLVNDRSATKNMGANSALLNVFGGFGSLVNTNIYLGGEVLFNTASTQAKITNASGDSGSLTQKNTWGVSFIPGVMLSDHTMAYARLGVVRTGFKATAVNASVASANGVVNRTQTGSQFGLGMQANVAPNVDVRGEYVYTSYRSFNVAGNKLNPTSGTFNVAAVYKFD